MTTPEPAPTLLDVVRVLSETYTDPGVLTWLCARNRHLPFDPYRARHHTPRELIARGRIAEVYAAACRIEGGS